MDFKRVGRNVPRLWWGRRGQGRERGIGCYRSGGERSCLWLAVGLFGAAERTDVRCPMLRTEKRKAWISVLWLVGATSLTSTGCISALPVELSLVSTEPLSLEPRILARDVRGSDCSWVPFSYGDYGKAIDDALAQVPGANILQNASFYKQETLWSICVKVRGDAGVL
jgi:hypothetical protein